MKSLSQLVKEALNQENPIETTVIENVNESSKDVFVRFKLKGLEGEEELESSIRKIGERDGIYVDEATDGIKVKVNKDSNVESLIELITEFCNAYKDKEENEDLLKSLYDGVSKLQEITTPEDDEDDDEEDSDEDE